MESQAPDELLARLNSALDRYRARVYPSNLQKLRDAISDTNEEFGPLENFEEEEVDEDGWSEHGAAARLACLDDYHFNGGHVTPPDLEAVADSMEGLLEPEKAKLVVSDGTRTPCEAATRERLLQGLESDVQKAAEETARHVSLPTDFCALMALTDRIQPAGLPMELSAETIPIWGLSSIIAHPLPSLVDDLRLGPEAGAYHVYAGFKTSSSLLADNPSCGFAFCERDAQEGKSQTIRAWRVVFAYFDDDNPQVFDSVVEFLDWYSGSYQGLE